jgi:Fic family protein
MEREHAPTVERTAPQRCWGIPTLAPRSGDMLTTNSHLPRGRIEARLWQTPSELGPRRPRWIDCYVPDPIAAWHPSLTAATAALAGGADGAVRALDRMAASAPGAAALADRLLLREATASARISGLTADPRRLVRAAAGAGRDEIARPIISTIHALELVVARAVEPRPLVREDILRIHRTLMRGSRDEAVGGVVRGGQTWMGGSQITPYGAEFLPPPPEELGALLDDLAAFLNRDNLPVTLQAAIAYAQFAALRPFLDGNSRLGRCLIQLVFRRRGLAEAVLPPVSLMLAADTGGHMESFAAYCFGDVQVWLQRFAEATTTAVERVQAELASRGGTEPHPRADADSRGLEQLLTRPRAAVTRRGLAASGGMPTDSAMTEWTAAPSSRTPRGRPGSAGR